VTAVAARRGRPDLSGAFIAAVALHVALFALLTYLARFSMIPTGSAVPITIVSEAPTTDSRAAIAAPTAREAQVETPAPHAPPPSPPPDAAPNAFHPPAPAPAPRLVSAPTPKSRATPAKTNLPPDKPRPRTSAERDNFSLDALQADVAGAARAPAPRPGFARRGFTQAETAPQARIAAGQGVSQSDQQGLSQLLNRLWNPNCSVEGADAVTVTVTFSVGLDGRLAGRVGAGGKEQSSDPVTYAAARRAIDAVHRVEPFPLVYRGNPFRVIFDARKACANR